MTTKNKKPLLRGLSEIRSYFHRNTTPIYFISATNFNLLGLDEWVRRFKFISYLDCFDRRHPNTIVPSPGPTPEFESIEEINNYLLQHKEVYDYVKKRGRGKSVFLMFDSKTERLAKEAGLTVSFPTAALRDRLDHKIKTVRIGEKAGVPSVPNVLARVNSYAHLQQLSRKLGSDLVLQTAYGDSGHTTFFVSSESDFAKHESEIVDQGEVKIMKRINCRQAAIEACATRAGTVVAPLMSELVGFKELTPYRGGWAGNELAPDTFSPQIRAKARELTFRFGEQLKKEGYRGYFELDFLIDLDTDEIWLGELNPRLTGASLLDCVSSNAHADMPLFMFHLLEFSNVDFEFDVDEVNRRWSDPDGMDSWSQMVIKHTEDNTDRVTAAPQTGIYRMLKDGSVEYSRFDYNTMSVHNEHEAFFLRISNTGDYRYQGADLGILITRGRLMTKNFRLTRRAKQWIEGIRNAYSAEPVGPAAEVEPSRHFKLL